MVHQSAVLDSPAVTYALLGKVAIGRSLCPADNTYSYSVSPDVTAYASLHEISFFVVEATVRLLFLSVVDMLSFS